MKLSKLTLAIAATAVMATSNTWAVEVGGRGIIDYTDVGTDDGVSDTDDEEWDITDARINVSGKLGEDYSYRAEVKYDGANDGADEIDYTDLSITYHGYGEGANITVGSQKEPFGLNALASGTDTTFLNRSNTGTEPVIGDAARAGRSMGVQVHGVCGDGNLNYGVGLFRDDRETTSGDTEILWAFTSRVAYSINTDGALWHMGAAYTDRDGGDALDDVDAFNLEGAWVAGPLSVQAEYTDGTSEDVSSNETDFDGYYINVAYSLTGETRPYNGGIFGSLAPSGDEPAYEIAVRFIDNTVDDGISEQEEDGFAIALNAYKNNNVRIGLEYEDTETEGATSVETDSLTIRTQFKF